MNKQRKPKASKAIEKKVYPAPIPRSLPVEYRTLDRLKPFERNARAHKATQVDQIAKSIGRFGFTNPILGSEDGPIIAGHGRYAAARALGMQTAPVIVLDGLTDGQRRQLVLADNRIASTLVGIWSSASSCATSPTRAPT